MGEYEARILDSALTKAGYNSTAHKSQIVVRCHADELEAMIDFTGKYGPYDYNACPDRANPTYEVTLW